MTPDEIQAWIEEQRQAISTSPPGAFNYNGYRLLLRTHLSYREYLDSETISLLEEELVRLEKAQEEDLERMMKETTP